MPSGTAPQLSRWYLQYNVGFPSPLPMVTRRACPALPQGHVRGAELRGSRHAVPLTELQLAQAIIWQMTQRVDLPKVWPVVLAAILAGVAISLIA